MNADSLHWKVAGRAGEGIDVTGSMFGKLCLRQGMNVFAYREYPSLIRGGHNTHQVHASFHPLTCQQRQIDLMVALNEEGISLHVDELGEGSVVFCEATQDKIDLSKYAATGAIFYDVPMTQISREETGHFLAQNVVSLGASAWILGLDIETLKNVVTDQFQEKGDKVVEMNHRALFRGYDFAKANCQPIKPTFEKRPNTQILLTGNQAVAIGAVSAGLQYFSAYPMTPTSEVLHTVAALQDKFPLVVKHAEDEISAVNQAIGASYAGVRAMTASATGGYALMVEATSLAAIMETPLVICVRDLSCQSGHWRFVRWSARYDCFCDWRLCLNGRGDFAGCNYGNSIGHLRWPTTRSSDWSSNMDMSIRSAVYSARWPRRDS